MKHKSKYSEILQRLVRCDGSVHDLSSAITALSPEQKGALEGIEFLVCVTYDDIAHILERYINGELSTSDVHAWASEIEMQEDIQLGVDEENVFHIVFKLSTPELEGELTHEKAARLLQNIASGNTTTASLDAAYNDPRD